MSQLVSVQVCVSIFLLKIIPESYFDVTGTTCLVVMDSLQQPVHYPGAFKPQRKKMLNTL